MGCFLAETVTKRDLEPKANQGSSFCVHSTSVLRLSGRQSLLKGIWSYCDVRTAGDQARDQLLHHRHDRHHNWCGSRRAKTREIYLQRGPFGRQELSFNGQNNQGRSTTVRPGPTTKGARGTHSQHCLSGLVHTRELSRVSALHKVEANNRPPGKSFCADPLQGGRAQCNKSKAQPL